MVEKERNKNILKDKKECKIVYLNNKTEILSNLDKLDDIDDKLYYGID